MKYGSILQKTKKNGLQKSAIGASVAIYGIKKGMECYISDSADESFEPDKSNGQGATSLADVHNKRLLADNVSIIVLQSLLGHSSIQTTAIYANPTEEIVKKELNTISEECK